MGVRSCNRVMYHQIGAGVRFKLITETMKGGVSSTERSTGRQ